MTSSRKGDQKNVFDEENRGIEFSSQIMEECDAIKKCGCLLWIRMFFKCKFTHTIDLSHHIPSPHSYIICHSECVAYFVKKMKLLTFDQYIIGKKSNFANGILKMIIYFLNQKGNEIIQNGQNKHSQNKTKLISFL